MAGVWNPPGGGAVYLKPFMFVIVPSSFIVRVGRFPALDEVSDLGVEGMGFRVGVFGCGELLNTNLSWVKVFGLVVIPVGVGVDSL